MKATVQCSYATYWDQSVEVEAETIDGLIERAYEKVGANPDNWQSSSHSTDTAIDAIAIGDDIGHRPMIAPSQRPVPYADSDRNGAQMTEIALGPGVTHTDVTVKQGLALITEEHEGARITRCANAQGYDATCVTVRPHGAARPDISVNKDAGALIEMTGWTLADGTPIDIGPIAIGALEHCHGPDTALVRIERGADAKLEITVRNARPQIALATD